MLINTYKAALKDTKKVFNGIGVDDFIPDIFTLAMANNIMAIEMLIKLVIYLRVIGHNMGFFPYLFTQDRFKCVGINVINMKRSYLTVALMFRPVPRPKSVIPKSYEIEKYSKRKEAKPCYCCFEILGPMVYQFRPEDRPKDQKTELLKLEKKGDEYENPSPDLRVSNCFFYPPQVSAQCRSIS